MSISQYWVGQRPSSPVVIDVLDSRNSPINLSYFDSFKIRLVGSDNEEIDTSTDRSLFTKPGDYLLQMELIFEDYIDFTTVHDIRVHKLGGKK
jgi:hypothetical protein